MLPYWSGCDRVGGGVSLGLDFGVSKASIRPRLSHSLLEDQVVDLS